MTTIPITGHTQLYGLLGSPVSHSLSPKIHNHGFSSLGIDAVYLCFDVQEQDLAKAVEGLKLAGIRGFNLTMPCKNKMAHLCDELSPAASLIGAVNTVVNTDGHLTGHITDGIGFWRAASEAGCAPSGKTATLMGMGGAATAIAVQGALDGLSQLNLFVRPSSRFWERSKTLTQMLNQKTNCQVRLFSNDDESARRDAISRSHLLINGTSLGMSPHTDQTILPDLTMLRPDLIVGDVIYHPTQTLFLKNAEAAGCKTFNGLPMLLYQAAEAFRLWTGKELPLDLSL